MISDAALKEATSAVSQAILDSLPNPEDCRLEFSAAFERKMRKLFRRVRHPVLYKSLQRAACILIVFILSASLFLTFHTEARAAVVTWIKEKLEDFYHYFSPEEAPETAVPGEYCLGWIPDGYTLLFVNETENSKTKAYASQNGDILQFICLSNASSEALLIGGGDYEEKHIETDKILADIYLAKDINNGSIIIWPDSNGDILLSVSAHLEEDDLIRIAENVFFQEES